MIFEIERTSGPLGFDRQRKPYHRALETDYPWDRWIVEINSLEDLMTLQKEVGEELIVGVNEPGGPYIEIYDTYRE